MKFKMRTMHFSPAGNAEKLADAISRKQQCTCDRIPPAYPCENEKLLFIGVELKGSKPDKSVEALCKDLTTARAKNVAFFAVGSSFDGIDTLKQLVKATGVGVVDDVFQCAVKGGLFSKGKVSEADLKAAADWSEKIVNSLV
jgi:flavodoxin